MLFEQSNIISDRIKEMTDRIYLGREYVGKKATKKAVNLLKSLELRRKIYERALLVQVRLPELVFNAESAFGEINTIYQYGKNIIPDFVDGDFSEMLEAYNSFDNDFDYDDVFLFYEKMEELILIILRYLDQILDEKYELGENSKRGKS